MLRRILIKRFSSVSGQLKSAKGWVKDTLGKELEELGNIKKNLKNNKAKINSQSKEILNQSKTDADIIKRGTDLKIKYMYKKAREGEVTIPFEHKTVIRNAERLIDTFDFNVVKNARKKALQMAKNVMKQKSKPKTTKANIDTNVDTGANTSSYFGADISNRKLEMFSNVGKKRCTFMIIALLFIIYLIYNYSK